MSRTRNSLALKPYLESIKNHCKDLPKEELLDIILGIARDMPAQKRTEFLEEINSICRGEIKVDYDEDLLSQIGYLKDEIDERISSIEDGSYFDEYDEWDNYYDEEPDTISEEQKEELEGFFKKAEGVFLSGRFDLARKVYETLFEFFPDTDEGISFGISDYDADIDLREERARYCRSVYETSVPDVRAQEMVKAMRIHAPVNEYHFDLSEGRYPLLQDVVDAGTGNLPDWENFLSLWKKVISKENSDRASVLLLEAVNMLEGIKGVAALARKWKGLQPRGYLFWIDTLVSAGNWRDVSGAAQEALDSLPYGSFRGQAARAMTRAGEALGDGNIILNGKRETFYSLPDDNYLLALVKEAENRNVRESELEKVLEYLLKTQKQMLVLQVKALLMAGKLKDAFIKAKNSECVGWSYRDDPGGVIFGGILAVLTMHQVDKAKTINALLKRYADERCISFSVSDGFEDQDREGADMSSEILKGLRGVIISNKQKTTFFSWAEDIGRRRIDHIVSNKHRKAYDRAAEVLGALAECFVINNNKEKGRDIIDEYRDRKYNRYPAFRREIDLVTGRSPVL